jgi:molybdopterin synthase sulfur carrier subunit
VQIILKFFGSFRELMGKKRIVEEASQSISIRDFISNFVKKREPRLFEKIFSHKGDLAKNTAILINGINIVHLDYLNTILNNKDVVCVFPVVGGG